MGQLFRTVPRQSGSLQMAPTLSDLTEVVPGQPGKRTTRRSVGGGSVEEEQVKLVSGKLE